MSFSAVRQHCLQLLWRSPLSTRGDDSSLVGDRLRHCWQRAGCGQHHSGSGGLWVSNACLPDQQGIVDVSRSIGVADSGNRLGAPKSRTVPRRKAASMGHSSAAGVEERETAGTENDLLIVGAGTLGSLVGQLWQKSFPHSRVVGQTNTTNSHDRLRSMGIEPVTKAEAKADEKFPFIIFCAPPSQSEDYVAEVRAAASRWSGTGSLLFTSSSAVFDVPDGGLCHEDAPVIAKGVSPRVDRLLNAEEAVLSVGGNVVRLAGLYSLKRGPQVFWMNKGPVDQRPDYAFNVIHYEDAADLCIVIMQKTTRGRVFVGCDGSPVTTQALMDAVLRAGAVEGEFGGFVRKEGPAGKRMQNDTTREFLGWKPKYPSSISYIEGSLKVAR
ncbi:hypothetical protein CBR_g37156 [Chara braunii]|uniref:NAD(P)-binding domain-containing protein n=1 Tax=Chara braunii TaxID=69332 RepID=A0A388LMC2_CHABU|nr:hypothetical protein CBR_g37156 [Chara braunii]|eukprot:GBG83444.1 hypothetical protein CBR_g37156 [Chara braunii]